MASTAALSPLEALFAGRTHGGGGEIAAIMAIANAKDIISFAGGIPDPATFPGEALADLLREIVASGDTSALQYAPADGVPGLRSFLADRLERLEGLRPAAAELIVTSGGMEALQLLGKALLDTGDLVLVEAPTYLGAISAFRGFDARVDGVPIDDDGLDVEALERLLSGGVRPKLLYVVSDYQNPAGVTLAAERRAPLVELARRHGFLVLEDVAYRELPFEDERRPSLWALAPETTVQVGTFSKTFCPGTRLGWVAGPAEVVSKLVWAKQNTDQCSGALGQRLLEEYGRSGLLDRQIVASRALYSRRCKLLLAALARHMPPGCTWTRPRGGFFSWLTLPAGADAVELAAQAARSGVAIVPGLPFYADGRGSSEVRLAFSRVDDDEIDPGVERLARALTVTTGAAS
ncbi:MAG: PLP-dependent aminotransferase family protein [Gaiellaceae bacterium]